MDFTVYQIALFEVANRILDEEPDFDFYKDRDSMNWETYDEYIAYCTQINKGIFEHLESTLEKICEDGDTYSCCMCGAIMLTFSSGLADYVDFDEMFFDEHLKSAFADSKMKQYLSKILLAISSISGFRHLTNREIIEWPDDFAIDEDDSIIKQEYEDYLLDAIDICPDYSYAYCLLIVPYIYHSSIHVNYETADKRFIKAIANSHYKLGTNLFAYLFDGINLIDYLTAVSFFDKGIKPPEDAGRSDIKILCNDKLKKYLFDEGYSLEIINMMNIQRGCFWIKGKRYPAGIPFCQEFSGEEFDELLDMSLQYVECDTEEEVEEKKKPDSHFVKLDSFTWLNIIDNASYSGLIYMMPNYFTRMEGSSDIDLAFSRYKDAMTRQSIYNLLDLEAREIEAIDKKNKELEEANRKLTETNDSLKEQIELNRDLINQVSHSSANYLNSARLEDTGIMLRNAREEDPTPEKLHSEGLMLIRQAQNESYMSRQLHSLIWKCSGEAEDLVQQIRKGVLNDGGVEIRDAITYALSVVLSRLFFREDDIRGAFILSKIFEDSRDQAIAHSSFLIDILKPFEDEKDRIWKWWRDRIGPFEYSLSETWTDLHIIENGAFYDLIVEIITEQLLNALSYGDTNLPFALELGEEEDARGRIRWVFITFRNTIGEKYEGAHHKKGIISLARTLMMINGNRRGVDIAVEGDDFKCTAWLRADLLLPLE